MNNRLVVEQWASKQYSPPMTSDDRRQLVELLQDLQHDLGKYLRMPLAFLPEGASEGDVVAAIRKGLFETRRSGDGVVTASELWERFLEQAKNDLEGEAAFDTLTHTVERALAWEALVKGEAVEVDRERARKDFDAVGAAIRDAIQALKEK